VQVYREEDTDPALIRGGRVAIVGYGNQGRAQALNLRDSGVSELRIALDPKSPSRARVTGDGLEPIALTEAAAWADLVMMLAPDEHHAAIYHEHLAANLRPGAAIGFSHGLAIRFGLIEPRADLDIFLVAPKGPGTALRQLYTEGRGMIALFAVHQDATGSAQPLALSYAAAIGSGRAGILPTSFAEECEADLFNEQAVLWGAIPELIQAGFDTLVEAGFSPEIAYFECLTEVKLLADLIAARGIAGMREAISTTARFGAMAGGNRIVTQETRAEMRRILAEVRAGEFTRDFVDQAAAGHPRMGQWQRAGAAHPIEAVGGEMRKLGSG
jgi:ketol-acid reductoisomerase